MSDQPPATVAAAPTDSPGPARTARWMLLVPLALHLGLATYYALALPLWGAVPDDTESDHGDCRREQAP